MKLFQRTLLLGLTALLAIPAMAQDEEISFFDGKGRTAMEAAADSAIEDPLEYREPIAYNNPRYDDVIWQKVVYRIIDLREKINFPLYFPKVAGDGRESLFTTMFRLYEKGEIKGYQYEDNREVFNEATEIPFQKIIDTYGIYVTAELDSITGDTLSKKIEEADIPNAFVLKYLLKEVWYFDKSNSTLNVRIMAICPELVQPTGDGDMEVYYMFWTPFDQLRPYLAKKQALLTEKNNGQRDTMDDLFMKRKFGSYIFKESNIRNRMLLEYCSSVEQVQKEQARIKTSIINFEQDLWEY